MAYLCGDPILDVVALDIADLRVEVEEGADLHRLPEPDVVHVHAVGPTPAEHVGVGPAQLEGLAPELRNRIDLMRIRTRIRMQHFF
jgi:hypothetical protein